MMVTLRDGPPKFTCPACGESLNRVVESRFGVDQVNHDEEIYWRRRRCLACQHIFYTTEHISTRRQRPATS